MKQERSCIAILDIPIDRLDMNQAAKKVQKFTEERDSFHLVATANAEMIMQAQDDLELKEILCSAALVVPDGAGVVWAARHYNTPLKERVAGFDLAQRLLSDGVKQEYGFFFLGAAPGIAEAAAASARKTHPNLRILGCRDGFFKEEDEAKLIEDINASGATILFVALGVPRQEKWLRRHAAQLRVPVAMGVGGTFDVMAGQVTRAPQWMQKAGLEWLYRLLCQPSRCLRMLALPRFIWHVCSRKNS